METGSIATQELYYANLSATQADKPAWFNDPALEDANNKVAKLKNDGVSQKIGPAILLKVMAGDSYNIRVVSGWNSGSTPTQGTNDIATLLLNALSGGLVQQGVKATATELQNGSSGLSNAITDFLNSQPSPGARPKAYINWVMLDEQFKYAGGGADPVGISGVSTVHTKTNLTVPKNGYLYIYTSNESNNIDVFFDNLQVTHTAGHILEETHYYPFGLVMAGISSRALNNIAPNNYKFNAGTELNSVFDLHYYETPLRNFDPQVGRFNCIDILAEKTYGINPYHFGNNCPVMLNDPTGALMEAGTGRAEKGPDGEYHVGWVSEMMWEYPTSFSFGSGKTEGGDFSTYWNYIINANFGDGVDLPTSIIANIPGFGESYFGNVNGAWGFFNSATNAGYTGNNSEINALSSLLTSFAKNGNSEISGRFFEMLGGNISHNIYTDRNQISTLNGIESDASGTVVRTNTFFSTQANGGVPENRIPNNGSTNSRAQFAADFLSITYLNAKYGKVYPSNQIANGYFNNGKVLWLQGNQASQRPQYGTQGQFVQSSKNASDRVYIENIILYQNNLPQRIFYMSLFMSAGGNQFEHSRMGYSGGVRNFNGIFMFDNVHF